MEFIKKILLYILFICFSITLCYCTLKNAFLFYALSIIVIIFVAYKFKTKHFAIFLFVVSFLLRLIAVMLIKTPIISDFAVMYNASKQMLIGDNSHIYSGYFLTWGYQMGHVIYQFLLLKICDSVLFLKVFNCIFASGTNVLIYLISKEITNDEKSSRIISLLYMIFLFPLLLNTVLTNQQLSGFAITLSIYIFICNRFDKWGILKRNFIIGILLVIANISRPESVVIIFSIILYLILNIKKYGFENICKQICTLLITYFVLFNFISQSLIHFNISPSGLENKNPTWKFVLGFNTETTGTYSSSDAEKYASLDQIDEAKKIVIDRTIGNLNGLPLLFVKKAKLFWTTSSLSWSTGFLRGKFINVLGHEIYYDDIDDMAINYNMYTLYTAIILFMIGLIVKIKEHLNNKSLLLYCIIFVYFGVYLLIEIMPRYAYSPQIFLFILSGFGVKYLIELYEKITPILKNERK